MSHLQAPPAPGRPAGRRRVAVAACSTLLVLGSVVTGCSSDDPTEQGSDPDGTRVVGEVRRPLRVDTTVTRVLGELSEKQRRRLAAQAKGLITGYFEAAYLHRRPGTGYRGSFPGFTKDARAMALRDTRVVTDRSFSESTEVRPRGGVAYLSVVAPDGRPVGATARVSVDLALADSRRTRQVTVSGRLLLTPRTDRWRIFGYDLSMAPTKVGRS